MNIIKFIVGILAVLYTAVQIIGLAHVLHSGHIDFSSAYAAGHFAGRIFGILIGAAIVIACFGPKKAG